MAAEQKDQGPFVVYGRRTEHEAEVRVGSRDDLDASKREVNDMVDSGLWHHASVRDKNDQTVHVGRTEDAKQKDGGSDDYQPAA